MFGNYIDPAERVEARRQLPRLFVEGLLLGGAGLGIFALIFEIAADAFSVAAYQTLLAIYGAGGYHQIAMGAFILLSALLFLGIVPAYKAGAYLRPNAGGSGPLVEAIGPPKMRWLSWIGTSLFFLDAILTIIIIFDFGCRCHYAHPAGTRRLSHHFGRSVRLFHHGRAGGPGAETSSAHVPDWRRSFHHFHRWRPQLGWGYVCIPIRNGPSSQKALSGGWS